MTPRSTLAFTLSLGLAASWNLSAHAQAPPRPNLGQQIQQQLLNDVNNRVMGQPNTPTPNPYPGANSYQPQQPGLGYGQPGYQQPGMPGLRQPQTGFFAQPSAARYQVPAQFNTSTPGSTLVYNGLTYIVNPDGTMSPASSVANPPAPPAPTTVRYQLPAQFAGSAPGTPVSYGGAGYLVNPDGTMSPAPANPVANPPAPPVQRYQIPAQFAAAAPGSTITYGARNYAVNNDNTMSPLAPADPR